MGVDYFKCDLCDEIYGDCGFKWAHCEGIHHFCAYCFEFEEYMEDEMFGYLQKKYCPFCIDDCDRNDHINELWNDIFNNYKMSKELRSKLKLIKEFKLKDVEFNYDTGEMKINNNPICFSDYFLTDVFDKYKMSKELRSKLKLLDELQTNWI